MFINGCPANSTVKDENDMAENIEQELRLNQRNKKVKFPFSLLNLPKRCPGCGMQNARTRDVSVPYSDKSLEKAQLDPDELEFKLEEREDLVTKPPEGHDKTVGLVFVENKETEHGSYTGTTIDGLASGYG